jgi:type IV pilus assembly protein PilM
MAMSFLQNLFKKPGESVLGVDIGASSIKVVQLRKKAGKAVLETYGELALGPYAGVEIGRATALPTEKITEALLDVIKEANVTTNSAVMSIAASASLLSFIKMPEMDRKQLAEMVPIEARKYIPVPISEVALDFWPIPKDESSFSAFEKPKVPGSGPQEKMMEILLVVIHNDVIAKMSQISASAHLDTSYFEIEVFSSMRSVVDTSLESHLLFDMGAGSTKLYIIERGILRSSHTVNRGSQEITLALSRSLGMPVGDAEHVKRTIGLSAEPENKAVNEVITLNLDYIFAETNRVISAYQQKYGKSISKVVLTGGGSLLKGFLDVARKRLETEVVMGDPFSKTEAPAFLEPVLRYAGPEFAVAIGAALRRLQEMQ